MNPKWKRLFTATLSLCLSLLIILPLCPFVLAEEGSSSNKTPTILTEEEFKEMFLSDSVYRNINLPDSIVGLWVHPGTDLLAQENNTDQSFQEEVSELLKKASSYGINTLYLNTSTELGTILEGLELEQDPMMADLSFDPVSYFIEEAKKAGFYVICTLDLLRFTILEETAVFDYLNTSAVDLAVKRAQNFAMMYEPDGVLLTNYYNPTTQTAFSSYWNSGSGIGLEAELTEQTSGLLDGVSYAIKLSNFDLAIGLLCDPVWANLSTDNAGSKTSAGFEMKTGANLDLPGLLENKTVDFVLVDAPHAITDLQVPLQEVFTWWADLTAKHDFLLTYRFHNEFACTEKEGFSSPDQIVRQVMAAENTGYYSGCCLTSLQALDLNLQNNTQVLIKHLREGLSSDLILKDLHMTRPTKQSFITYDNSVQFTGTSDPNFPLLVNGESVEVTAEGNFSLTYTLKTGVNTFTLEHKSTSVTYTITKKIRILDSIAPSGDIAANGNMTLTFSAMAYEGSVCELLINGAVIPMEMMEIEGDHEENRENAYRTYVAYYTLPEATEVVQNLGEYQIKATYNGSSEVRDGGIITLNAKLPPPEDSSEEESSAPPDSSSVPEVSTPDEPESSQPETSLPDEPSLPPEEESSEVTSETTPPPSNPGTKIEYASDTGTFAAPGTIVKVVDTQENGWVETLQTTTLDNWATPLVYYYVPGTYDYVNGKMLTIQWSGETIHYYNLCSGRRIFVIDTEAVTDQTLITGVVNNRLDDFSIDGSGKFTTLTFKMTYPVNPVISLEGVDFSVNTASNHTVRQFNPTHLLIEIPYIGDVPTFDMPEGSLFDRVLVQRVTDPESGIRKLQFKLYFKNGKAFSGVSSKLNEKGELVISVRNKMSIQPAENQFGYSLEGVKIGITPGHGGGDIGASGFGGVNEVDLNFAISDLVGKYLEEAGAEVVQLPRNITDRTEGLIFKMENARAIEPDILLCLHHNSSSSSSACGTETYYYAPFTQPLAEAVNDRLAAVYPVMYGYSSSYFNRGDKYAPKYMCRDMRFPAILVEYGFVNNPTEFAHLSKAENQDLLAKATVLGIIDYILAQQ